MISRLNRKMKGEGGFNMIELMVVVVIVGVLAAIAVPIYSKYVKNSRVTEATGRMGDILTAAKSYAIENDPGTGATHWNWPETCATVNFIGDCSASPNFTYALVGADDGDLTITATGTGRMLNVTATMTVTGGPTKNGTVAVTGV